MRVTPAPIMPLANGTDGGIAGNVITVEFHGPQVGARFNIMRILTPRGRLKWLRTRARAERICRAKGEDPARLVHLWGRPNPAPLWNRYVALAPEELGNRNPGPWFLRYSGGLTFDQEDVLLGDVYPCAVR